MEKFTFDSNFRKKLKMQIKNAGDLIEVELVEAKAAFSGGSLATDYVLHQWHFHWGPGRIVGRKRFYLESHFVFYADKYETYENAVEYDNGIVVLGVFYELTECDNKAFDNVIKSVGAIARKRGHPVALEEPVAISDFFPPDLRKFYRYKRPSLVAKEGDVTWIMFSEPSYISESQYRRLTQIYGNDDKPVKSNYRNLEDLSGMDLKVVE